MRKEGIIALLSAGLFFCSLGAMKSSEVRLGEKIRERVQKDFEIGLELIKTLGVKKCSLLPIELRQEILVLFANCASQLMVNKALAHLSSGIERDFIATKILERWNSNYRGSDHRLSWPEVNDEGRSVYSRPYDIEAYLET